MASGADAFSRLEAKRREQTPQALARLVVVGLFIALWLVLFVARIPMPVPFLFVLALETLFFLAYLRIVRWLPSSRSIDVAQGVMLAVEIIFHTAMVYFLGGVSWLGAFAYVFGLIFANTFLDIRRGFFYTTGAAFALGALIVLEATGTIPHQVYLEQGPLRYTDGRFVATTALGAVGVFYSIYLWVNWVGFQLRQERDTAVRAQEGLLQARAELQRANEELEERVRERTAELELVNVALRENEAKLRTVITNAPVILFAIDADGVFTLSEGKGLESLGLEAGDAVGLSVFDVYASEPAILENFRRALAGEAFSATVDFGDLAFETHYAPTRGGGGAITGVIGIATDITERRQAEAALRESEERFRRLAENAVDVIFRYRFHPTRGFDYVSPAAKDGVGYSPEEFYADPDLGMKLVHPDDRELMAALLTQDEPKPAILRWQAKDGGIVWVETRIVPIYDEDGRLLVVEGIARDVSERLRAEQALRDSEERYRWLIESAPDAMVVVDGQGHIVIANSETERLFGYRQDELLGKRVEMLVPERLRQEHVRYRDVYLEGSSTRPMGAGRARLSGQRKDGSEFPVEISLSPLSRDGETLTTAAIRDVTEREQAEEALRQSEEVLRGTIESTEDGILVLGPQAALVHVNARFFEMWNIPEEVHATGSVQAYIEWTTQQLQDADSVLASLREIFSTDREGFDTLQLKDGRVFESYSRPLMREDDVEGRVFSFRDVTERKHAELALRESEAKFRTMAEAVAAAVLIVQGTKMRYVNSAAEELTGYSRDELLEMNFWDVIHPEYRELVRERGLARQRGADVPSRYEMKISTKSGRDKWVDFTGGLIDYEGKPAVLGTAFDISDRKRAEEALREHANRDPLTGLLNRRAGLATLAERLELARSEAKPYAVLVLDLDRFKSINDTFSHETGDNALLLFAQVMSDLAGDRGVVARLGGDEFEIGLGGFAVEEARAFAETLHAELRRSLDNAEGDAAARFSVSIGIACYPDDGDSLVELGRLADRAMYHAKGAGGARSQAWRHIDHTRAA